MSKVNIFMLTHGVETAQGHMFVAFIFYTILNLAPTYFF